MNHPIKRREFLQKGAAAVAAASVSAAASGQEAPKEESAEPVRIGVVGVGGRGRWHVKNLLSYQENVVIPGIYVEGVQPHHQWGKLDEFAEKYEHEFWRKDGETARRAGGHGGIDYHCVRDFVTMVRENRKPWIDAYDCATWSSLVELSRLSIDRKGGPVEIPDFTQGKWEDPDWRKGRMV